MYLKVGCVAVLAFTNYEDEYGYRLPYPVVHVPPVEFDLPCGFGFRFDLDPKMTCRVAIFRDCFTKKINSDICSISNRANQAKLTQEVTYKVLRPVGENLA